MVFGTARNIRTFYFRKSRLIQGKQGHHKARRTKTALRPVVIQHRLLHRVQRRGCSRARFGIQPFQALNGKQNLSIERRQKSNTGVDIRKPDLVARIERRQYHSAGPTIALRTPFFGTNAMEIFPEIVEQCCRRCMRIDTMDDIIEKKTNYAGIFPITGHRIQLPR